MIKTLDIRDICKQLGLPVEKAIEATRLPGQ